MFIIEAKNSLDYVWALFLLSHYHVRISPHSDADTLESLFLVITEDEIWEQRESHEDACNQFRLCEMAFQANFTQKATRICQVCQDEIERTGEGHGTCGHLVFESYIIGGM